MRLFFFDCFCFVIEMRSEVISLGREDKMLNSCFREWENLLIKEMNYIFEVLFEIFVVMCFFKL